MHQNKSTGAGIRHTINLVRLGLDAVLGLQLFRLANSNIIPRTSVTAQ